MLGAVIFDFDGVITDSEVLHFRGFNEVLAQFNIEISTRDYYKTYLGFTDFDCFKKVTDKAELGLSDKQINDLITQKSSIYEKLVKTEGKIIEGVRDFLQMLSQNNVTMAICSGALLAEIELILEDSGLRKFFQAIVSADHITNGKPHPEPFLLTLEKLNEKQQTPIHANQCVVVEDSHWGLQAAKAAGMHTIAVTNSYDADQLSLAEKIVDNLRQLSIAELQQICD